MPRFEALGMNWCYLPFPVRPEDFGTAITGVSALGIVGINLTIPYKQSVLPYLDSLSPDAERLGAVNTVTFIREAGQRTRLHGTNTDAEGFIKALRQAGYPLTGDKRVMVIGSGGAARAVVFGLVREGIREIAILNRSVERAERLADDFKDLCPGLTAHPLDEENILQHAGQASLLVNTTPLGTWPDTEQSVWPEGNAIPGHLTVFDLVYNPPVTSLLRQAGKSHAVPIGGLEMLVQQGGLSFQIWTGIPAPLDIMRETCRKALGEKNDSIYDRR